MDLSQAEKFIRDANRILGEKELIAKTDQQLRVVALDLYRGITQDTPVETGWLRATWNLARGQADTSVPPKPPKGQKLSGAQLRASEGAAMASFGPDARVRDIWITTAAEYALPIEYGHSKAKAPQGMVRVNLARIVAKYSV